MNKGIIKGFLKFLKRKISSVKSADYLGSPTYPFEIKQLLKELGIDYRKESEICHYCKLENGKHFYGGWFHFKGKILEGRSCKINLPNGGGTFDGVAINEHFHIAFLSGSNLSFFDKEENKELIQIEFLANSKWVIDKELESG